MLTFVNTVKEMSAVIFSKMQKRFDPNNIRAMNRYVLKPSLLQRNIESTQISDVSLILYCPHMDHISQSSICFELMPRSEDCIDWTRKITRAPTVKYINLGLDLAPVSYNFIALPFWGCSVLEPFLLRCILVRN